MTKIENCVNGAKDRNEAGSGIANSGVPAGRRKETGELLLHVSRRESFHIYGPEGTGKSALLDWLYDNWQSTGDELIPIYCRSSRTLRQVLLYMAVLLLKHFKQLESIDKFGQVRNISHASDVKRLSIKALRNIVYAYMTRGNFCVFLDHLEHVTPQINGFLTTLYEKALVITASRQSWELADYRFRGNLAYSLYLTPKLPLSNLPREDACLLMEHLCGKLRMELPEKTRLFREIYLVTAGNPGRIVEIMSRAGQKQYLRGGICNLKLVQLDIKIEKPADPRPVRAVKPI